MLTSVNLSFSLTLEIGPFIISRRTFALVSNGRRFGLFSSDVFSDLLSPFDVIGEPKHKHKLFLSIGNFTVVYTIIHYN